MNRYVIGSVGIVVLVIGVLGLFRWRAAQTSTEEEARFGGMSLSIEYAITSAVRERGLSGRVNIPDNYGMLFVFPTDGKYGFWMKDMLVPIDIFWLDAKGQVIEIDAGLSPETYPRVFYPPEPVRYVLETRSGFADTHHITVGTPLILKSWPNVSQ